MFRNELIVPDLCIYVDISVSTSILRAKPGHKERQSEEFTKKVYYAFLRMKTNKDVCVLDGEDFNKLEKGLSASLAYVDSVETRPIEFEDLFHL